MAWSVYDRRPVELDVTWSGVTSVDMGASWTSDEIDLPYQRNWSIDAEWEGADTPTGTMSVEASNGISWNEIPDSVITVNGASSVMWTDRAADYGKIRVVYSRTSGGSGDDCTATLLSKG